MKLILTFLIFCSTVINAQNFTGGSFTNSIACKKNPKWSYAVYLPKDYDHNANRKWATMINFGAVKGGTHMLKRMVEAAEITNCILICSIETSNRTANNGEGMQATINDVLQRFKVHEKLFFVTGMSGGARRAFLANSMFKKPVFTGVLPCGANGYPTSKERKVWFYGACGSNCYNREQMAVSFRKIGKQGKLVYFAGKHVWAGQEHYTEGVPWLYANNLNNISPQEYDKYYKDFLERLKAKADSEQDIYRKFRFYSTLALVKRNKDASEVKRELQNIMRSQEIQIYLKAEKEFEKFLAKYYTNGSSTSRAVNSRGQKAAEKIRQKYPDAPFSALLELMVKPAASF